MKINFAILMGIIGILLSLLSLSRSRIDLDLPNRQSLYNKVIESGTLRVGYTVYPPGLFKDGSGDLKGIGYDVLNEIGKRLSLDVVWIEEVGWATQVEGLRSSRYDIIGTVVWPNPKRARVATLSKPLFYSPLHFYSRIDDDRFSDWKLTGSINNSDVKISAIEGATAEAIVSKQFPNATRVTLPQTSDVSQSFLDVVGRKADLVVSEPYQFLRFEKANPSKLKTVSPTQPLRVFGNSFMFLPNESAFENMINLVIEDLMLSGFIEERILHYEKVGETQKAFGRVAPDYILLE